MDLKKIINNINDIDKKMLELINKRIELVLMTRNIKDQIIEKRNRNSLKNINEKAVTINLQFIQKIYNEIIRESEKLRKNNIKIIAFQGEHGAYSEVAAKNWNNEFFPVACETFSDVFEGIEKNIFDIGIVPVENTLGGNVNQVNDILLNAQINIVGAVDMSIHHCLISKYKTDIKNIKKVYSHPQALAQCRYFLEKNNIEPISYYDTAGSAKMIAEKNMLNTAVIASKLSADIYGLNIIKENIEDLHTNKTRFLVISNKKNVHKGTKCSIVFSAEHKAGSLFEVLEIFAENNINLTRIESIPSRPGSYAFFMDFIGSIEDNKINIILDKLTKRVKELRIMGCYNEIKIDE